MTSSFLEKLTPLVKAKAYEVIIELYDGYFLEIGTLEAGNDTDGKLAILGRLPIKWMSMNMLGYQRQSKLEIEKLIAQNEEHYLLLTLLCSTIRTLPREQKNLLDDIASCYSTPQRVIISNLSALIEDYGDNIYDEVEHMGLLCEFETITTIPAVEYEIAVSFTAFPDLKFSFEELDESSVVKNRDYDSKLKAKFTKGKDSVVFQVPIPEADYDPVTGYLTVVCDGKERSYELLDSHCKRYTSISPFGLNYCDGNVQIQIKNVRLHQRKSTGLTM